MTAGDELGELCRLLLDSMRENLEEGYEEMWKTIENQKKLNAAFAHDLRTPTDSTERIFRIFSQISAPGARVNMDKMVQVLGLMVGAA